MNEVNQSVPECEAAEQLIRAAVCSAAGRTDLGGIMEMGGRERGYQVCFGVSVASVDGAVLLAEGRARLICILLRMSVASLP